MNFKETANENRKAIKHVAEQVKEMHEHPGLDDVNIDDEFEAQENITLAYRHLEDAAMRLGKAIQAFDGGVSIYDK